MNVRPLMRLLRGGGEGTKASDAPRFRVTVDVEVDDVVELLAFTEQMHARWFSAEAATKWREAGPDIGTSVVEALVILNQNPPRIGLTIDQVSVEEIRSERDSPVA